MAKKRDRAELILHRKQPLNSGLLVERKIWRVPVSTQYPHGIKYRMILVDPELHKEILLYDNHWPKGPHVHWRGGERSYEYLNLKQLLKDFFQEYGVEEKRYYENKKDSH